MKKSKDLKEKSVVLPDFSNPNAISPSVRRFEAARAAVLSESVSWEGIGTLSEKSLHKILKLYIEPDTSFHEVLHLGYVNDIKNSDGIYEIQTRNYEKLLPKLKKLLPENKITVVSPLATDKSICWLDKESGEITSPRRSTKRENIFDAFKLLFGIREVLTHPNLTVRVLYLKVEDFRYLNGYGKDKKHYSTRIERIPSRILCEVELTDAHSFASFLPSELNEEFTASEFSRAIKRTSRYSYYVLKMLVRIGVLSEAGKRGRAIIYRKEML